MLRPGRGGRSPRPPPPPPDDPAGCPGSAAIPPPSRGARRGRGLGRKEPGKGGVGAGRRGVGGGEGGSGGPAALRPGGAPPCGRGSCPHVSHPCSPPPSAAVKACLILCTPEVPSRGRHSARANWGGGGRGRRELARGSVSIRDAKFLLR